MSALFPLDCHDPQKIYPCIFRRSGIWFSLSNSEQNRHEQAHAQRDGRTDVKRVTRKSLGGREFGALAVMARLGFGRERDPITTSWNGPSA